MKPNNYIDCLWDDDRLLLETIVRKGARLARDVTRAHILLMSDAGHSEVEISGLLGVCRNTVWRTRDRWIQEGAAAAVTDRARSGRPSKVTPRDIAQITALACSDPPPGVARWNHRLLTDELNARGVLSAPLGRESVRSVLLAHDLKPWKKRRSGVFPS